MWQVVSADHSGLVRLNNYPAVCAYTPCFAHRGHASHVTRTPPPPQPSAPSAAAAGADGRCGVAGVAFLSDDSRVISCGGSDQATYQWKLRGTYTSALNARLRLRVGLHSCLQAPASPKPVTS